MMLRVLLWKERLSLTTPQIYRWIFGPRCRLGCAINLANIKHIFKRIYCDDFTYCIYSFKRRPRLSALAYESKNIKERRPRIFAALIHNNAAFNLSTVRQNCSRSQTKKHLQYILILNQPWKFILLYYSVFKFKVSIFQCSPIYSLCRTLEMRNSVVKLTFLVIVYK